MDVILTPKVYLRGGFELFYLEIGPYKGAVTDNRLAVEWIPANHFALGFGFESFNLAVEANGSTDIPGVTKQGALDFRYSGLMLYLRGFV